MHRGKPETPNGMTHDSSASRHPGGSCKSLEGVSPVRMMLLNSDPSLTPERPAYTTCTRNPALIFGFQKMLQLCGLKYGFVLAAMLTLGNH